MVLNHCGNTDYNELEICELAGADTSTGTATTPSRSEDSMEKCGARDHAAEELCINTVLPILEDDEVLRLVFEYSDRDGGFIDAHLMYRGDDTDPLEDADELSLKLIRHSCKDLSWECNNGQCSINCRLV